MTNTPKEPVEGPVTPIEPVTKPIEKEEAK